jgi:tetratricopeptide (TPR) repeat protein
MSAEFTGTDRFTLVRRVGAGGMGVVYEAVDQHRGARIALKTLSRADAEAIYQLKQEFRAIAGVTHLNLVSLYELHAAGDVWFITMELVAGLTFREYVMGTEVGASDAITRTNPTPAVTPMTPDGADTTAEAVAAPVRMPAPACDLVRLRAAVRQLVEGVRAIHTAGKLHRDLKPSNVLVTSEGRVVILDFGIVADLPGAPETLEHTSLPYAGTPIYMAPEQYGRTDLTESADWYAVGVMLFEALTGRPPFAASSIAGLAHEKMTTDGPRPSSFADGVPADLDDLCEALLRSDRARRPSGDEIGRLVAAVESPAPARRDTRAGAARAPAILVGRDDTLADLRAAQASVAAEGPAIVFLRARSGMGKTAVLQAFLEAAGRDPQTVVLSGRCFESESVPFKALDALMDSLARYLRRLAPAEIAGLLPRRADALARMFPTLARVPAFAEAPQARGAGKDAVEDRQVASAALREFAGRLTDRATVVMAIDDLQWGDLDSALLLGELLAPPDPPPVLLLAAARSEQSSACLAYLRDPARQCRRLDLALPPLGVTAVAELQARLHPGEAALPAGRLARITADAGGNPFLIREVLDAGADADAGQEAVAGMIRDKVDRLDPSARRLVEFVALSAKPLSMRRACEAAEIDDDGQRVVAGLRNARLLRTGTEDQDTLETYHDRIRETLTARIGADRAAQYHARLVDVLSSSERVDAEHLAFHLEGAGRGGEAASLYIHAAEQASRTLAFDHAVALYERALRLRGGAPDATLIARLAEALADAGRSRDAGERFAAAARLADPATRRELTRRAAYYFCISGRIDEGKAALGEVLKQFGISLPKSTGAAIASVLFARFRLRLRGLGFKERAPDTLPPDTRERLDSLWAAAIGLGNTEVISGIGFSSRGLIQALDAGDPVRIVRAMCWEACLLAVDDVKGARRLIDRADVIVRTCETPYLRGMIRLAEAIYTINLSRWRDAIALFDQAEALWLEHGHGVDWELNTARHFCSWALINSGELAEARRRIAVSRREAADRGNLYVTVSVGAFAEPQVLLAADQPGAARARREDVMALWTEQQFNVQHIIAMLSEVQVALYEGDGRTALDAIRRQRAAAKQHGFDRLAVGRVSTDYLMLNSVFMVMGETGVTPALVDEATQTVRRLDKETLRWGKAASHGGRAGLAIARGDIATAVGELELADAVYAELGMHGFACAARRHRGELIGGPRGQMLMAEADSWRRDHGVADPGRWGRIGVHVPPIVAAQGAR